MASYNPEIAPDVEEWLALDESERIHLVMAFHKNAGEKVPNPRLHASMHVAVENQIALGDSFFVKRVHERLMSEGLDRHDALHAVASVLAEYMFDLMKRPNAAPDDSNAAYEKALSRLSARKWRSS